MPGTTMMTIEAPRPVGRKQVADQESGGSRNINFRCPNDLYGRLEGAARGLGLDVSNFVRMLLVENIGRYEQRVRDISGQSD